MIHMPPCGPGARSLPPGGANASRSELAPDLYYEGVASVGQGVGKHVVVYIDNEWLLIAPNVLVELSRAHPPEAGPFGGQLPRAPTHSNLRRDRTLSSRVGAGAGGD